MSGTIIDISHMGISEISETSEIEQNNSINYYLIILNTKSYFSNWGF